MNGWKQLRTLALALIALAALGIPDAHAAQGRHCAYELDPVSKIGRVTQAQLVLIGCYDTFAEAVSAGTGGSVTLDASASPDQTTDAELAGSGTRGLVTIGTEWGGSGFTGASNSYLASTTCSAQNTWEVSYVGDTWNDRFSSGKGFGGCDHNKKFEDANFGGNVLTCTPNCSDYGALSNKVSSLRWKP